MSTDNNSNRTDVPFVKDEDVKSYQEPDVQEARNFSKMSDSVEEEFNRKIQERQNTVNSINNNTNNINNTNHNGIAGNAEAANENKSVSLKYLYPSLVIFPLVITTLITISTDMSYFPKIMLLMFIIMCGGAYFMQMKNVDILKYLKIKDKIPIIS